MIDLAQATNIVDHALEHGRSLGLPRSRLPSWMPRAAWFPSSVRMDRVCCVLICAGQSLWCLRMGIGSPRDCGASGGSARLCVRGERAGRRPAHSVSRRSADSIEQQGRHWRRGYHRRKFGPRRGLRGTGIAAVGFIADTARSPPQNDPSGTRLLFALSLATPFVSTHNSTRATARFTTSTRARGGIRRRLSPTTVWRAATPIRRLPTRGPVRCQPLQSGRARARGENGSYFQSVPMHESSVMPEGTSFTLIGPRRLGNGADLSPANQHRAREDLAT